MNLFAENPARWNPLTVVAAGLLLVSSGANSAEPVPEQVDAAAQVAPGVEPAVQAGAEQNVDEDATEDSAADPTQDIVGLDGFMQAFGWSFDATVVKAEKLGDGLFLLFGTGGNVAVSIGEQGTLLVDDQFPQMMPKLKSAIENLGGGAVDFVVNTHWHFDHADGNLTLGPEGAWIVAHEESQKRMGLDQVINLVSLKYGQPAYPKQAQPVISFADRLQFHFNGQDIELRYFGPAHTTGDTAVFFKQANAVHLGGVFTAEYPFIDVDNGGDLDGVIHFCEAVLAATDENTKLIPGHGALKDRAALTAYVDMLRDVRGKIAEQVVAGASLEAVIASQPTAEFDAAYGDPTRLVDRAYASLKRTHQRKLEADAAAAAEAKAAETSEATEPGAPTL